MSTSPRPPAHTCPREDADGNPSPPVVLADAGTHPRPPAHPREPFPVSQPAPVKTQTGIHPLPCPRGCGDPSPSPAHPAPVKTVGNHPLPLSSRMRGPIPVPPLTACPREDAGGNPSPPVSSRMRGRIPPVPGCGDIPIPPPLTACPREDADGNPPPPVVLAHVGTHPSLPQPAPVGATLVVARPLHLQRNLVVLPPLCHLPIAQNLLPLLPSPHALAKLTNIQEHNL